ncbi:MAG: hypothetical protein ACI8XB_001620 [Patiriisocius sp.]|jgi:hypothetical protein
MDFVFEKEWKNLLQSEFSGFDLADELEAVLFVLGIQVLGQGNRKYSKDDKINLMHIAVCTILVPYEFYNYIGLDEQGWPHFEVVKELPNLTGVEQERFLKEAIISYFRSAKNN